MTLELTDLITDRNPKLQTNMVLAIYLDNICIKHALCSYLVCNLNVFFLVIPHRLYKKAQDHKDSVKAEIQERNKVTEEISAVTNALQNAASVLLQDADGKAEQLEVGNSSVIVYIFTISPGLCWCLHSLQIKINGKVCSHWLRDNESGSEYDWPCHGLGLCSFPSVGICKHRRIFRLQRNSQPAAFLLGRAAQSHPASFPSAYLPRAAPDALHLMAQIGSYPDKWFWKIKLWS